LNTFKRVKNYFLDAKSRTFSVILNSYSGMIQWVDANFDTLVNDGYKKNVYVYSAIRAVSKSFSSVSWGLYLQPQTPQEDLKRVFQDPILDLMNRPNPFESGLVFRFNLMTHLLIYGNAYIEEITPNRAGAKAVPKELYLLRPDRVQIVPSMNPSKGLIKEYIYEVNGLKRIIPADKILHLKYNDPDDDFYGFSPIKAAGLAIDQNNLAKGWNIDILNNGGMPNGSLSTSDGLTEDQFRDVEAQMKSYNTNKRGQTLILQGGLKYERFSMSAEDMGFVNATKMSAREICIVFGVPPEILGDSTNKTYNNYAQARKAFYEETIIPELDRFEEEFCSWLIAKFNYSARKYKLTYNKEDIEAIQEDVNIKWEKANSSYFLTLNEKRNLVGYDDVDNGEVFLVPNNFTVVTELKDLTAIQDSLDKVASKLADKPSVDDDVENVTSDVEDNVEDE
jgi:HK97 family phage portal protein